MVYRIFCGLAALFLLGLHTNCSSNDRDAALRNAAILITLSDPGGLLTLAQTAAMATDNASASATNGGNSTIAYGSVQPTAITRVNTSPHNYAFYGEVAGTDRGEMTIVISTPDDPACSVTILQPGSNPQGVADFTDGTMSWTATGDDTDYSGSSTQSARIEFDDYGTFFTDYYAEAMMMKESTSFGPVFSPAPESCADFQQEMLSFYERINRFAIIRSGNVDYTIVHGYSGTTSAPNTKTANTTFTVTLNSPAGIVVEDQSISGRSIQELVTLDNLSYTYSFTTHSFPYKDTTAMTSTRSITITGSVNGIPLNVFVSLDD